MKKEITPASRGVLIAYRVIVAVILALIVVLVAGSLYALARGPDSGPLFRIGSAGENQGRQARIDEPINVFSGIGRLRIPASGEPPAAIVISISFPYPAEDRSFVEELASRIGDFRSIATVYFSSVPREKLSNLDEAAAKAEILRQYNALLRLGKIETLFFGDFMVVD